MSLQGGVYQITNTTNGKRYIGSSCNLHRRRLSHFRALRDGKHFNIKLQRAWNRQGEWVFQFIVLERCPRDMMREREQWYIDNYHPEYNIATSVYAPSQGVIHTEDTKRKISAAHRGRKHTLQARENMARGQRGKKRSPESIAKGAAANTGKVRSPEVRSAIAERNRIRIRIRNSVPISPETRAKLSSSHRGIPQSKESRAKRSETITKWWAARRSNGSSSGGDSKDE